MADLDARKSTEGTMKTAFTRLSRVAKISSSAAILFLIGYV